MLNSGVSLQRLATKAGVGFTPKKLFSNGEAGVWYDPSDVEASLTWRRNLLEYTESLDNSYWGKGPNTVVTPNHGVAPNGTQTADRVEFAATSGTYFAVSKNLESGKTYTFSVYAKATSSTSNFDLYYNDGSGTNQQVGQQTATSEWQRFEYTITTVGVSTQFGVNNAGDTYASDILFWGAQLEEGSTATEYQPILSTFDNAFKQAFPKHTLYQDDDGETAVTGLGQAVGLMLDKSQGVAFGDEEVTNGDFSNGTTGWISTGGATATVSNNAIEVTWGGSGASQYYQAIPVVIGKTYYFSGKIDEVDATSSLFRLSNGANLSLPPSSTEEETITAIFTATTNTLAVGLRVDSAGSCKFSDISVKEIQGSHATQSDSTKRPVFARHPERGRVNLLKYTEEVDNGVWNLAGTTVTPNATIAPDGTTTADKVIANTVLSQHRVDQTSTSTAGVQTLSAYVKNAGYGYTWMRIGSVGAVVNIANGVTGFVSTGVTVQSQDVGNGWRRVAITTSAGANEIARINMMPTSATADYTGDGTSGIYIWGAQLEEANEATGYQKVVDDYDITESGYKSVYYLQFDGVNDCMKIPPLTSSVKPLTVLLGYSATNLGVNAHRFLLDIATGRTVLGRDSNGTFGYHDGTWRTVSTVDPNAIKVMTYDLVANDAKMRENGIQFYSDTTYDEDAVSGDISLFSRFSLDQHFVAGNLYQFVLRAEESTDKEIDQAEEFVAIKTGLKSEVVGLATLDLNFGANTYTARNSNGSVL